MEIKIVKKSGYNSLTIDISGISPKTLRKKHIEINYYVGGKLERYGERRVIDIVRYILENEADNKILLKTSKEIKTFLSANLNKMLRTETTTYKLENVKEEKEEEFDINGLLTNSENSGKSIIILGASGTGKTSMLTNMLSKVKKKSYDKIIIFTESPNSLPLIEFKKKMKNNTKIFDVFVPKIVYFLHKINEISKNKYKFLIILDDVIDLRNKTIGKMMLTMRNSNITTLIITQYSKLITPSVRSSAWYTIITNIKPVDWENIIKQYGLKKPNQPITDLARELHEKYTPFNKIMALDNIRDKSYTVII